MGTALATAGAGWLLFVLGVLCIVLVVAWILLPFAMFGMKPLLRELITEQKRTNALLEKAAVASSIRPVDRPLSTA